MTRPICLSTQFVILPWQSLSIIISYTSHQAGSYVALLYILQDHFELFFGYHMFQSGKYIFYCMYYKCLPDLLCIVLQGTALYFIVVQGTASLFDPLVHQPIRPISLAKISITPTPLPLFAKAKGEYFLNVKLIVNVKGLLVSITHFFIDLIPSEISMER